MTGPVELPRRPAPGDGPVPAGVGDDETPIIADETTGRGLAVRSIGYVPALDGLRAIAVLLVVDVHITGTFLPSIRTTFLPGGFLGVDIFFVLSGFLITSILVREFERSDTIKMGRFYLGRVLRLMPALAAFLVVQVLWTWSIGVPGTTERPAALAALTYLSNWGTVVFKIPGGPLATPPGIAQLWSLAVEEQFYLIWPLVLFVCLAVFRRRLVTLAVTGGLILIIAVHRLFDWAPGLAVFTLYSRTDYRGDTLLIGAFAAQLWVAGWVPRRGLKVMAWVGVAVIAGSVAVANDADAWLYRGGYDLIAIAVAIILLAIVETDWSAKRLLSWRGACALGVVSYGFYIWHPLAFAMVAHYGHTWPTASQVVGGLALAVAMTLASWFLIERPFLRIKDRLRGGVAPQPTAPTDAAAPQARRAPAPAPPAGTAEGDDVDPLVAALFAPKPPPD